QRRDADLAEAVPVAPGRDVLERPDLALVGLVQPGMNLPRQHLAERREFVFLGGGGFASELLELSGQCLHRGGLIRRPRLHWPGADHRRPDGPPNAPDRTFSQLHGRSPRSATESRTAVVRPSSEHRRGPWMIGWEAAYTALIRHSPGLRVNRFPPRG